MATKTSRKISKSPLAAKEIAMSITTSQPPMANKLKEPKVFIPLIIIVLVGLAFYLKGFFIAALVNGQPISRLAIIQELEKQGGKQALSALVNQTLILQEAKKKNIDASQKEIDASVKQVENSLKSQGQNLDTALAMSGMTRKDPNFLMQIKLRILAEKLLADKIKVSDKEISDYIDKNKTTLQANLSADEIKKEVKQSLEQQKFDSASQTWLTDLAKSAKINYFVNY